MPQIAQQDYIRITDPGTLTGLQQDTKNILKRCIKNGSILEVLLTTKEGSKKTNVSRVVAFLEDTTMPKAPTYKVTFINCDTGALSVLSLEA